MKKIDLNKLKGKTKKEIIEEMGHEFNYFPHNIWTYLISKNWFGRKRYIILKFKDEMVSDAVYKSSFKKIGSTE